MQVYQPAGHLVEWHPNPENEFYDENPRTPVVYPDPSKWEGVYVEPLPTEVSNNEETPTFNNPPDQTQQLVPYGEPHGESTDLRSDEIFSSDLSYLRTFLNVENNAGFGMNLPLMTTIVPLQEPLQITGGGSPENPNNPPPKNTLVRPRGSEGSSCQEHVPNASGKTRKFA